MNKKKRDVDELMEVVFLIRQVVEKMHREKYKGTFSPLHLFTLHFIDIKKNPSMKEVADFLLVTPSSATSLIDSMVRAKILMRVFDKKDRRAVRIKITPTGEKTFKEGHKFMDMQIRKVFSCLNLAELKQLLSIYRKILNFIKKTK